jgi:hypothetical protein
MFSVETGNSVQQQNKKGKKKGGNTATLYNCFKNGTGTPASTKLKIKIKTDSVTIRLKKKRFFNGNNIELFSLTLSLEFSGGPEAASASWALPAAVASRPTSVASESSPPRASFGRGRQSARTPALRGYRFEAFSGRFLLPHHYAFKPRPLCCAGQILDA